MSELFDTSAFSSLDNDAARDFEIEDISSKKKVQKSSYKSDSAWDDGSAFPDISSKKIWKVGDRIITPANQRGLVTSADKKIGITWENGHLGEYTLKQIQAYGYQEFLEEKEATECNSHNLTSAQELEPVFARQDSAPDSSLSESQKLMNTAQASSQNGSPMSATTVMCEVSQCEISENSGEKSTLLQLRHHASPFQSRESDKEKTTPATVSPPSNEQLNQSDPNTARLRKNRGKIRKNVFAL